VYSRGVAVVIEKHTSAAAAPAAVFAYLHDPDRRGAWDVSVERAALEAEPLAVGARLRLAGRRLAPSWLGEYVEYEPPRRSKLRLVEGDGMPFHAFAQTITVAPDSGGSLVTLRLEYEPAGALRLLEPVTLRTRLRKVTVGSLDAVRGQFA
jgi:uncharacterized protein YndB with AHSA1/START domain